MSYNTTREAIDQQLGRSLFRLRPLFDDDETPREVLVSLEVRDVVEPPWQGDWTGYRFEAARAVLDHFTSGGFVTVAHKPFSKPPGASLARVDPVGSEVWDFRCLAPAPGIRLFGRFAERDSFVALTFAFRESLGDRHDWAVEVAACKAAWSNLFGVLEPHRGGKVDDYISYNARPV